MNFGFLVLVKKVSLKLEEVMEEIIGFGLVLWLNVVGCLGLVDLVVDLFLIEDLEEVFFLVEEIDDVNKECK